MKPTLLIIEDNPYLGELLEIAFTQGEFEVLKEDNGLKGQEMALVWQPEYIILDIMMPELDGLSVLSRIRDELPLCKIVICSNLNQSHYQQDAKSLGADLVLDKSAHTPREIVALVKAL